MGEWISKGHGWRDGGIDGWMDDRTRHHLPPTPEDRWEEHPTMDGTESGSRLSFGGCPWQQQQQNKSRNRAAAPVPVRKRYKQATSLMIRSTNHFSLLVYMRMTKLAVGLRQHYQSCICLFIGKNNIRVSINTNKVRVEWATPFVLKRFHFQTRTTNLPNLQATYTNNEPSVSPPGSSFELLAKIDLFVHVTNELFQTVTSVSRRS